jgi:Mlc titration factor MtfA (ptsG expression regulator)
MSLWRRRRARELPQDADSLFARHLADWGHLTAPEQQQVRDAVSELLQIKKWQAARGFDLTDSMCTVIAAQAALMSLGLGLEVFHGVDAIVVHPTTMVSTVPRPGPIAGSMTDEPVHLLGEAHHHGPVLLAWDAVRRDTRHRGHGSNVVIHELTHKLDMLDGMIDGTPPLPAHQRRRWIDVCTREFEALRATIDADGDDPLLRDYAATDTGEFFAVAAEVFFGRPTEMAHSKPDLYAVLRDYFRCDPAARRAGVAGGLMWENLRNG